MAASQTSEFNDKTAFKQLSAYPAHNEHGDVNDNDKKRAKTSDLVEEW